MRRTFLLICIALMGLQAMAQKEIVSGTVTDARTGRKLTQASVTVKGEGVSVVTNDDGYFTLKTDTKPDYILVSHLGYETKEVKVENDKNTLRVRLKPTTIELRELVVWTEDPRELVRIAIRKIPSNYSKLPELYNCFYRETAMKRNHFIYVAEGVTDMYKTAYNHGMARDRVAIRKGRRLISRKESDTLGVKVMGGPVQPLQLDIAKNTDFLLNAEELENYKMTMEVPTQIDGRLQYVVSIAPCRTVDYALYYGKLYIDRETLAFTRAELTLDMSDRDKATRFMLMRKPIGVRFRPKELSCLVDYRYEDGVTRLSYIRNTFRFNCDWKKRLLSTSFTATCEMVVTDKSPTDVRPISGRDSFDSKDFFYDRVEYFRDPDFWKDYNIIEPTETLDNAIGKLLKRYN